MAKKLTKIFAALALSIFLGLVVFNTSDLTTGSDDTGVATNKESSSPEVKGDSKNTEVESSRTVASVSENKNRDPIEERLIEIVRSDIKTVLSSIAVAEKTVKEDIGRFTTDLKYLGFLNKSIIFSAKFGFLSTFDAGSQMEGENPSLMNTDELVKFDKDSDGREHEYGATAEEIDFATLISFCHDNCTANEDIFEIIAAANLDEDTTYDVWTINEKNELKHLVDDLAD